MKHYKLHIILFLFLMSLQACEKGFEDLNKNPYFPTQTDIGPLFNFVVESTQLGGDEQLFLYNEVLYPLTQQAALTAETFQNTPRGTKDIWDRYYTSLANVRELERRFDNYEGDQEATYNVRAQLKTLQAYQTFKLTDLFGDIPFFDGKGFESLDYLEPKFDAQEDIYSFLLEELKWVQDHMNLDVDPKTESGEAYLSFGGFDNIFNASGAEGLDGLKRWVKFANALRLRYAVRMLERNPTAAHIHIKDIMENNLEIIEFGEDVGLFPNALSWKKTSTHWSFYEHKKLRMGSNIWNQMSTSSDPNGSGIFDPRAHIFFETNNANAWQAFPQIPDANTVSSGGIPYQGHRDINYNTKGNANIYSAFNYYLVRDEDDVPEIMITAAEVNFLKAEIYLRGLGIPEDIGEAHSEYTIGVVNSIKFWQNLSVNTAIWTNAPFPLTEGEIFSVTNHPKISIFNSTNKLDLIYTQRWLDHFRQPWEAYALARRTMATPREGSFPEYYRFVYPSSERQNNAANWSAQALKMGGDENKVQVWWMTN